jgi:hypothetical protein
MSCVHPLGLVWTGFPGLTEFPNVEMILPARPYVHGHACKRVGVSMRQKAEIIRLPRKRDGRPVRVQLLEAPGVFVAVKVPEVVANHAKRRAARRQRTQVAEHVCEARPVHALCVSSQRVQVAGSNNEGKLGHGPQHVKPAQEVVSQIGRVAPVAFIGRTTDKAHKVWARVLVKERSRSHGGDEERIGVHQPHKLRARVQVSEEIRILLARSRGYEYAAIVFVDRMSDPCMWWVLS